MAKRKPLLILYDPKKATPAERQEIVRRIREAAGAGRTRPKKPEPPDAS